MNAFDAQAKMAGTPDVLKHMEKLPGVHYPVLVPNQRGLEDLYSLSGPSSSKLPTDEIAIFTAATDAFNRANTNCSVAESLARLRPVASSAIARGLRVRGYVSVVITCPYTGKVDPRKVKEVTKELVDMGCYEVSFRGHQWNWYSVHRTEDDRGSGVGGPYQQTCRKSPTRICKVFMITCNSLSY